MAIRRYLIPNLSCTIPGARYFGLNRMNLGRKAEDHGGQDISVFDPEAVKAHVERAVYLARKRGSLEVGNGDDSWNWFTREISQRVIDRYSE